VLRGQQKEKQMTATAELPADTDLISFTADIVSAYVSNNAVPVGELPKLIGDIHQALQGIGKPLTKPVVKMEPAVSVKKSVTPDYIICLEDGKKFRSLKRHLSTHYNLSPEEYRQKWNLPADYPMVAPNYAAARSALAKALGLGRKRNVPPVPAEAVKAKRRARVAAAVTAAVSTKSPAKKKRSARAKV